MFSILHLEFINPWEAQLLFLINKSELYIFNKSKIYTFNCMSSFYEKYILCIINYFQVVQFLNMWSILLLKLLLLYDKSPSSSFKNNPLKCSVIYLRPFLEIIPVVHPAVDKILSLNRMKWDHLIIQIINSHKCISALLETWNN